MVQLLDRRIDHYIHPRRLRGRLMLQTYVGWGSPQEIEVRGRVLLPRSIRPASKTDPRWRNIRNIVRRMFAREVGGLRVVGQLGECVVNDVSDSSGYFTLRFTLNTPLPEGWHEAQVWLPNRQEHTTARVRVVGDGARFGIISDLDDTVIQSDVTSLSRMVSTVLTGNARTRSPFPGVGALYRALTRNETRPEVCTELGQELGRSSVQASAPAPSLPAGKSRNPIFYVSSSPWNFFDLLWQFLDYRRIPLGPLFLRNWGVDLFAGHGYYKRSIITQILERFPHLQFVLVGDSGEQDPHIYAEIVRDFPGRILAVYIRDVSSAAKDELVLKLREQVSGKGVDLVLAPDSLGAAGHALALGLITPRQYRSVLDSIFHS